MPPMTALPASAVLTAWLEAVRLGRAGPDDLASAVRGDAPRHLVVGLDGAAFELHELPRRLDGPASLALPVPGDPLGLGGPQHLNFAAIAAGQAVLCGGLGLVPEEDARPFATGELDPAAPLAIVSYARDRAQAPSIEAPCLLASTFGGAAAIDCAVNYGASGAPVFQGEGEAARLVAVVSAMGKVLATGGDVTLAVLVEPGLGALIEELRAAPLDGE